MALKKIYSYPTPHLLVSDVTRAHMYLGLHKLTDGKYKSSMIKAAKDLGLP